MHFQCANALFTDCGAKACSDHVITIITALAEYKAGLPVQACIFPAKALKMKCHMVTVYSPSKTTNKHTTDNPLHGIGQGSTYAPPCWTFNVDICKKCYDKAVHGFVIQDPTGEIQAQRNAAKFVDGTKLAHNNGKPNLQLEELMNITSNDIAQWDTYLNIDGRLVPHELVAER
eukprot:9815085-Ditylum_brightwellii.AAC.1